MDQFHLAVANAVRSVRQQLAAANVGSTFRLDVEVSGRIQDGDVIVTYRLGDSYGANNPAGARLGPVVQEFLRRRGWNEANAPLCLEAPDAEPTDETGDGA